jgi:uncharacterized protein YbaP (TraB family)
MKKTLTIIFLSFFIFTSGFAQTSVWKITNNKGSSIYLGGTVHLLSPKDYPLPKEFDTAYKNSESIAIEADIEQMESPAFAQKMMGKIMYQDDRTLSKVLDKSVYELLKKECAKYNLPIGNLEKLKPSMVIVTLTGMKMKSSGITSEGVDKHFLTRAKKDEKEVLFLESTDSQLNLLANMGDGNESNFVKKSLKELSETETLMDGLISDWRKGEHKIMGKQIKEMKSDYPKLHKDLLVNRNNNWIPVIDNYLSTKKTEFVLMGALHLHGKSGILNLLEKKGYTIKQL